ncbi:calponin homology domain-containing protein DDB_G0272472-like [Belonocnema kinseyi]|uniref:calponin homology domain-containing protein DDB_G0272472-like n=1 Tax=Belonocnema kinseyi TaxID=2817044 RepID=UPI00143D2721|nr:calponin homology domain-containing protein DDB_G0272472-like [Belonocnema kinseyi]
MEENEDEPEDVRLATPVEDEIKKADEPEEPVKEHFNVPKKKIKDDAKKRKVKLTTSQKRDEDEDCCTNKKIIIKDREVKWSTIHIFDKECQLLKPSTIPRHCLSKKEHLNMLATPSRKCEPQCLKKPVTRKLKPISPRIAELARPPIQRILRTIEDRGDALAPELLDNLINMVEAVASLNPEQAAQLFHDKKIRSTKKCKEKKGKIKCRLKKEIEKRKVEGDYPRFDPQAVCCQYLIAERFVKSILDWKCPIPREEYRDIADVILRRLSLIIEYTPIDHGDRKSQQMRFLADVISCWISGVLLEVAEDHKKELEEECVRRKQAEEEETEEEEEEEEEEEDSEEETESTLSAKSDEESEDDKEDKEKDENKKDEGNQKKKSERDSSAQTEEQNVIEEGEAEGEVMSENEKAEEEETERRNAEEEAESQTFEEEAVENEILEEAEIANKRAEEEELARKQVEKETEMKILEDKEAEKTGLEEAEIERKIVEEAAEAKRIEEAENARLEEEQAKIKKLEEKAEKIRLEEEAEKIRAEKEAENIRAEKEAEKIRAEKEAEKMRAEKEAEKIRAEKEAEKIRAEKEAEKIRVEKEAKNIRIEEKAEQKKLEEAAEKKNKEKEAEAKRIEALKEGEVQEVDQSTTTKEIDLITPAEEKPIPETKEFIPIETCPPIKVFQSDLPFVTFIQICNTLYSMIENKKENTGQDPVINRLHRSVYEIFHNAVLTENPTSLTENAKDVIDVMAGKIATWLSKVLTESQILLLEKYPPEAESKEVRHWSNWIHHTTETAGNWSLWLQKLIEEVKKMQDNKVTRGQWEDFTLSLNKNAILWRRFHLETLHKAHHNIIMLKDREVVKTGEKKTPNYPETELNAFDLE